MKFAILALTAAATFASTQENVLLIHLPEHQLILVARGDERVVDAHDERTGLKVWSVPGVRVPRVHAISPAGRLIAVADPIENQVLIISAAERDSRIHQVPQTPAALAFLNNGLFVVSRDADVLTRIEGARRESVSTDTSPTHLVRVNDRILVHSPLAGTVTEYFYEQDRIGRRRTATVARYAADFDADRRHGYLVYPRTGKMVVISLERMQKEYEVEVGAVPVDAELQGDRNVISAGVVSVADPSSKRIWRVERSQSTAEAFGRGFLRGLLGLGLYTPTSSEFPTGIDRIWSVGSRTFAYDSSSGRLYQIVRGKGRQVGQAASPLALAPVGNRLAIWNEQQQTLEFRPLPN